MIIIYMHHLRYAHTLCHLVVVIIYYYYYYYYYLFIYLFLLLNADAVIHHNLKTIIDRSEFII